MIRRADIYGAFNAIDQWKLIALVTMTIDHIGYFLFPDMMLFRVIGRASFPIWLFLVGYHAAAQPVGDWQRWKRNLPLLLLGCGLLMLSNFASSRPVFPMPILFTILCTHAVLLLRPVRDAIEKQPLTVLVYVVIAYPIAALMEYGSLAMVFAMFGFQVRSKTSAEAIKITCFVAAIFYSVISNITFSFGSIQEYLVIGIVCWVTYRLAQWDLEPRAWMQKKILCLLSRNSLYYYVLHVLFLKALGAAIHPPKEFFLLKFFS